MPSQECIELNDKGVDCLTKHAIGGQGGVSKAIDFLNQAIKCDSAYLTAYLNIAIAFDRKKDYQKELFAYNKAVLLSKNHPSILTQKGIVFEKMNKLDSANKTYILAKRCVKDSLAIYPKNSGFISDLILLLALTEGKDAAIKELDKQINSNPQLSSKLASEYYIYKDFDKKIFLTQ